MCAYDDSVVVVVVAPDEMHIEDELKLFVAISAECRYLMCLHWSALNHFDLVPYANGIKCSL